MSETLVSVQLYEITYTEPNDGSRVSLGYFTNERTAKLASIKVQDYEPRCYTVNAWKKDGTNEYFKYELEEIVPDIPEKEDVLGKLTKGERIALGIS